mgnify:CR=1 FL=1|jgi:hypothetical protein|tara:strand:- start:990 stop:2333 length:1344 start_codon:yes stop_codon:yes gene_type:complete
MVSFRARVLEALDIKKTTVKLQVNERFPKIYIEDTESTDPTVQVLSGNKQAITRANAVPYAVSKEIKTTIIGPNTLGGPPLKNTLDVLGFVVGAPTLGDTASYKNMYPVTFDHTAPVLTGAGTHLDDYDGFHDLGGLYDIHSKELQMMRKSGLPVLDQDTMRSGLTEHAHKDWPDNITDQFHLLNENPYADSLFYHSTRLSFLLTGITIPDVSEKASNHRGLVRMLIIRPRLPTCKMRWGGNNNEPAINMAYPPHWDTDLFHTKTKTLGGRLSNNILTRSSETTYHSADKAHLTPSFGFHKHASTEPAMQTTSGHLHYGHEIPDEGATHNLTAYDIMSAPINREKYAVIVDKTVHLDTIHHGVASKRIENVVIPYNKRVKFPGRKPKASGTLLMNNKTDISPVGDQHDGAVTFNEPLNMESRPIIMFLSMDQKISAQVTGYTTISET